MLLHKISYYLIRAVGVPISYLPNSCIHGLGNVLGYFIFLFDRKRRKRALSNLSIVKTLSPTPLSLAEKKRIARRAFQSFTTTCLEFFKLFKNKGRMEKLVDFANLNVVLQTASKGKGLIIFAAHMANWEAPFLGVTQHLKGMAIGKSFKNQDLYQWIVSIRQMHGAEIILPKEAMQKGTQALKEGKCLGIVGDQAYPESSYSYPLFGVRAFSSAAPAVLSYRTGAPIIAARVVRKNGRYKVLFSDPIWPQTESSLKVETKRIMDHLMVWLEDSIRYCPGQWLWQHNRWKQVGINHVQRQYRHDFILVILPKDPKAFNMIAPHLFVLRNIYPKSFFTFFVPSDFAPTFTFEGAEDILPWKDEKELFVNDWRYQMVIDLAGFPLLKKHYLSQGTFSYLSLQDIEAISSSNGLMHKPLSYQFAYTLCKPHVFKDPNARKSLLSSPHTESK